MNALQKSVAITTLLGFFVPMSVFASIEPLYIGYSRTFCERRGYTIEQDIEARKTYCVFDNQNKCEAEEFVTGECGEDYATIVPCRRQGEDVLFGLESCCAGLKPRIENKFGGQYMCVENMNIFQRFWRWLKMKF